MNPGGEAPLLDSVARALGGRILEAVACTGGDINDAWKLRLEDGGSAFLKSRAGAPLAEFEAEAAGLRWLAEAGTLPVPEVLAVVGGGQAGLVLEWVEPAGRLDPRSEAAFGAGLAGIHRAGAPAFGFLPDGAPEADLMVGPVSLGGGIDPDHGQGFGPTYAKRLERLTRQARDRGSLEPGHASRISVLCERIDEFAGPPEAPSRVHGDLWSGNVLAAGDGTSWLIDPVAHGAHRELDLAMLSLFGAPSERFFAAYGERFPLAAGRKERVELWQIQPLLVHAILFGGSYGAAAGRAADRYI